MSRLQTIEMARGGSDPASLTVGRYVLHRQIARGGMATIHIARLMGDEGFSRIVAAKRLLPEFAEDADFVAMFLDEARIASKIRHRNVVPVLDLVATQDSVLLVQEYVHGAPVHWLLNKARQDRTRIPLEIAVSIASQVLAGLHAAHEMVDELGTALEVVHRDVSPQNVMIATDGTARLLDFGVAKATMAAHVTREGAYVGKIAYSAPEQLRGKATRQSDIYSLAVMLWELIVGHRMHHAQGEAELVAKVMNGTLPTISEALANERLGFGTEQWLQLDAIERIVKRGLAVSMVERWSTAAAMEQALVAAVQPASASDVAAWLKTLGKDYLDKNDRVLAAEEASWRRTAPALGRRTPAAGEHRTMSDPTVATVATVASSRARVPAWPEPAPTHRSSSFALIGVLGLVTIALALGIVLIVKRPTEPTTPEEIVDTIMPNRTVPTLLPPPRITRPAATAPVEVATPPHERPPAEPVPVEPAPVPEPAAVAVAPLTRTVPPRQPTTRPALRPAARGRQPPTPTKAKPRAKSEAAIAVPTPTTAAPVATPADARTSCSPPYYFNGAKKIFKPACL